MGQVTARVILRNARDVVMAQLGHLAAEQVHTYEAEALIDTESSQDLAHQGGPERHQSAFDLRQVQALFQPTLKMGNSCSKSATISCTLSVSIICFWALMGVCFQFERMKSSTRPVARVISCLRMGPAMEASIQPLPASPRR